MVLDFLETWVGRRRSWETQILLFHTYPWIPHRSPPLYKYSEANSPAPSMAWPQVWRPVGLKQQQEGLCRLERTHGKDGTFHITGLFIIISILPGTLNYFVQTNIPQHSVVLLLPFAKIFEALSLARDWASGELQSQPQRGPGFSPQPSDKTPNRMAPRLGPFAC